MIDFLYYLTMFIVAIMILVAVHEFGHFWVARRCGVKVIRFSLGFGPPVWKYVSPKDGTEYVLAPIPLGGYVKMLGEAGEEGVTSDERDQSLNSKPIWQRMLIVLAGPFFNILLTIAIFSSLYMIGVDDKRPVVANTLPNSYAQRAGFQEGDIIRSVDGEAIRSWGEFFSEVPQKMMTRKKVSVAVTDDDGKNILRTLDFSDLPKDLDPEKMFTILGLLGGPKARIGYVSINPVLDAHSTISIFMRQNTYLAPLIPMVWHGDAFVVQADNIPVDFRLTPAARANLQAGDQLLSLTYTNAGQALTQATVVMGFAFTPVQGVMQLTQAPLSTRTVVIHRWADFANYIAALPGVEINVQVKRNQSDLTVTLIPQSMQFKGKFYGIVGVEAERKHDENVLVKYGVLRSLAKSVEESWSKSVFMLQVFGQMITGHASLKNVSGPLTIADKVGEAASYHWVFFLQLLALISLSLAVINLLPIPMLDGGHFMFYTIEAIKGSPVSDKFKEGALRVGITLLLSLMALAFYNDIVKYIIR